MDSLSYSGPAKYRRWLKEVYAAIDHEIGPAAGENQGEGDYENVRFRHSVAHGKAGDEGYVLYVVTLTGRSLRRGARRDTTYRWTEESDTAKVGRELVDVYADLSRDERYARSR